MKKLFSLCTIATFIVFSISCYTMKEKRIETVSAKQGKITAVLKTSGEYIKFDKGRLGRISNGYIIGQIGTESISIPISDVAMIYYKEFNPINSFLAIIGTVAGGYLIALLIFILTWED